MAEYLRTLMAPVFYRDPAHKVGADTGFELKPLQSEKGTNQVCILDELLGGGLLIPDDLWQQSETKPNSSGTDFVAPSKPVTQSTARDRSLLMLLSGPSGTGKSTFALELCCRLARAGRKQNVRPINSYYVSAEEPEPRLRKKAESFKWPTDILTTYDKVTKGNPTFKQSSVIIRAVDPDETQNAGETKTIFQKIAEGLAQDNPLGQKQNTSLPNPVDIVVLDSINVLSPSSEDTPDKVFADIRRNICRKVAERVNPMLVIVVLDGSADDKHSKYWEYVSDIVIRFGWEEKMGYTLRTFEMVKVRGQHFAWGKQRLKICKGPKEDEIYASSHESPYLNEGGLFIFPSVHWHLSQFRREKAAQNVISAGKQSERLELPDDVKELGDQMAEGKTSQKPHEEGEVTGAGVQETNGKKLHGGLPLPGCTAFVGDRGSMKSHLAYMILLDQALNKNRNTLLISFRDDIPSAVTTMQEIATQQQFNNAKSVKDLIKDDHLEIIHNEVGYISPEEFFHKIYVAIKRPREGGEKVRLVVINGLDQLEARYPLISSEAMFVPALIQLLNNNDLCTIIVSADGEASPGTRTNLYGLTPMADLLIKFQRLSLSDANVKTTLQSIEILEASQVSSVEIVRVPAGQVGGKKGYLYRDKNDKSHYKPEQMPQTEGRVLG